jgi:hypothetical protein
MSYDALQRSTPLPPSPMTSILTQFSPLSSVSLLLHTSQCPDIILTLEIAPDGTLKAAAVRSADATSPDNGNLPPFDDLIRDAVEGQPSFHPPPPPP